MVEHLLNSSLDVGVSHNAGEPETNRRELVLETEEHFEAPKSPLSFFQNESKVSSPNCQANCRNGTNELGGRA